MCGIAGYSVSPEWAEKYCQPTVMPKVLQEAWFHNIHRGHQAAGFFALGEKSQELTIFKAPGQADQVYKDFIVDKEEVFIEPVSILGTHTREPTMGFGSPKDNANNHPVTFNGCSVIHNGTIYNDENIRESFNLTTEQDKALGDVDSVAIAMVLSLVDPASLDSIEQIAETLSSLPGGMAIHAVWENRPGYSLLARGSSMPMVVAYHPVGGVFYGSETMSIMGMLEAMEINAKDKDWVFRNLDEGTMILIKDGRPIDWAGFKPLAKFASATAHTTFYKARYLPKEGKRAAEMVYATDLGSDYLHKTKMPSVLGQEATVIYSRKTRKKTEFPKNNGELSEIAVLAEADNVYTKDGLTHAFFGEIEIVLGSNRVLRDVFNHTLFKNEDRFVTLEKVPDKSEGKAPAATHTNMGWDDFFKGYKKTTSLTPPANVSAWKFLEEGDKGKAATLDIATNMSLPGLNSGSKNKTDSQEDYDAFQGKRYFAPEFRLDWKYYNSNRRDIYVETFGHIDDDELIFVHDIVCREHNTVLSKHPNPRDCKTVLQSAAYTLSCFFSVDLWWYLATTANGKQYVEYHTDPSRLSCANDKHSYVESEVVRVYGRDVYWEIITAEECYDCGDSRRVVELPEWFEKLDVSERTASFFYVS